MEIDYKEPLKVFAKEILNYDIDKGEKMPFIIGGSLAMYIHGFKVLPHDIDMELSTKGLKEEFAILAKLEALDKYYKLEGNKDASIYPIQNKHFHFKFGGVIFDIWVVDKFDYKSYVKKDGFKFADILSVLQKKANCNRKKDIIQILNYSRQISDILKCDEEYIFPNEEKESCESKCENCTCKNNSNEEDPFLDSLVKFLNDDTSF